MSNEYPEIIPGYLERRMMHDVRLEQFRWECALGPCGMVAEDTAARVNESKHQFPWTFFRGDCHSHSQHSDGVSTVAEIAAMSRKAGLDFQFVTDHWGVTQAPECREHGLWYGQEPATQYHHLGILGLEHAFEPKMNLLADCAGVEALGGTPFIPHPTGWWPTVVYNEEQKRSLDNMPSPFLMEICNGANNIVSAFDYTDESAVELWDHLLLQGKVVHAMGNTDAHFPHAIGMVWNGVFAEVCERDAIIAELRLGHSFVSDAPLLHIALGEARMGDRASEADRVKNMEITTVDSRGLSSVAVIADGAETFYHHFRGDTQWTGSIPVPEEAARYVRVQVYSRDGRRAFSNPIYL